MITYQGLLKRLRSEMAREWREDDPLNGPRMLFGAMVAGVVSVVAVIIVWRLL